MAVSGVVVARMLGVQNRGYLALLILWPSILARLVGAGLPVALPYFISREAEGASAVARLALYPAAIQVSALTLAQSGVLLVILPGKPAAVKVAGILTLAVGPVSLVSEYLLAILQGQKRFPAYNILRTCHPALYGLLVLALFLFGMGQLVSITSALVTSMLLTLLAMVFVLHRNFPGQRPVSKTASLKEMFGFGLRGLLGSVSPIETFRLDQAVIGLFLTPAALGLYVVALAFTNLPRFVAQSIGMVAYPYAAGQRGPKWSPMWPFIWLGIGLSGAIILLLIAAAPFLVPTIFGTQFSSAVAITQILLIGSLFFSARRVLTDASRGLGNPSAGSLAEVASWIWLVPSIALLLPRLGILGVAIALSTAAAFSLLILCVILVTDRPIIKPKIRQPVEAFRVAPDLAVGQKVKGRSTVDSPDEVLAR
jgi:O-antigen/teichoic acid export membrane protein